MKGFWKGVAATVIGGILLFLATTFLKVPLTPTSDLAWGISPKADLPNVIEQNFDVITQYDVLLENRGGATARDVKLYFEEAPSFVTVPNGAVYSWKTEGNFDILEFDAISAGESAAIKVMDQNAVGPVAVRVQGEPVEAVQVIPAGFGGKLDSNDWLMAIFFVLAIATSGSVFVQDLIRARRLGWAARLELEKSLSNEIHGEINSEPAAQKETEDGKGSEKQVSSSPR